MGYQILATQFQLSELTMSTRLYIDVVCREAYETYDTTDFRRGFPVVIQSTVRRIVRSRPFDQSNNLNLITSFFYFF